MLSRDACLTRVDRPPQPPIRANNFPEFREFHCEIIEISRLRYKSMSKEFIDELSTAHRRRVSSKWSRLKRERCSFEKIITNIFAKNIRFREGLQLGARGREKIVERESPLCINPFGIVDSGLIFHFDREVGPERYRSHEKGKVGEWEEEEGEAY